MITCYFYYENPDVVKRYDISDGHKIYGYKVDGHRPVKAMIHFKPVTTSFTGRMVKELKELIFKCISKAMHPAKSQGIFMDPRLLVILGIGAKFSIKELKDG